MSFTIEVDFYNSYILQKAITRSSLSPNNGPGYPGPYFPGTLTFSTDSLKESWFVEEGRIRGGYNNVYTDQGVRAYLDEEYPLQQNRISTLIYSGIYNSRTGINQTNVFSTADAITKSLDPVYGSIQKTYAEETNLIVFQENRIHRALIDKDTIYTTESGTQTQAGAAVIGQFVQYKGEYGISKNPESFAIYNYRKYFSDKNRNAVMRLSNDGLTEISMYGMMDWFRDNLAEVKDEFETKTTSSTVVSGGSISTTSVVVTPFTNNIPPSVGMSIQGQSGGYIVNVTESGGNYTVLYSQLFSPAIVDKCYFNYKTRGKIIGGWDIHNKNYVISLQKTTNQVSTTSEYQTVTFDENINGWVSFLTFKPNLLFSVLNKTYTTRNSDLYQQYDTTVTDNRGLFYGIRSTSSVTFVLNPNPSTVKNFKTISYEGSNGWEMKSFKSGFTGKDVNPSGASTPVQSQDNTNSVLSYDEGLYTDPVGQTIRTGFARKENRYVANLVSNSPAAAGEVIYGADITGVKGYFATVKIETDGTTDLGGAKELWSSGSNYVISSY